MAENKNEKQMVQYKHIRVVGCPREKGDVDVSLIIYFKEIKDDDRGLEGDFE